jgi:hypothetical protein
VSTSFASWKEIIINNQRTFFHQMALYEEGGLSAGSAVASRNLALSILRTILPGTLAGMAEETAGYPFDLAKVTNRYKEPNKNIRTRINFLTVFYFLKNLITDAHASWEPERQGEEAFGLNGTDPTKCSSQRRFLWNLSRTGKSDGCLGCFGSHLFWHLRKLHSICICGLHEICSAPRHSLQSTSPRFTHPKLWYSVPTAVLSLFFIFWRAGRARPISCGIASRVHQDPNANPSISQ